MTFYGAAMGLDVFSWHFCGEGRGKPRLATLATARPTGRHRPWRCHGLCYGCAYGTYRGTCHGCPRQYHGMCHGNLSTASNTEMPVEGLTARSTARSMATPTAIFVANSTAIPVATHAASPMGSSTAMGPLVAVQLPCYGRVPHATPMAPWVCHDAPMEVP